MNYRTFVIYNSSAPALWGIGVTTLGYFLGQVDVVKNNIEIAIVAIIAVSLLPVDDRGHPPPAPGPPPARATATTEASQPVPE